MDVSDSDRKDPIAPVSRHTGRDPISAVKMPESLTAAVDSWAETHHLSRSDAIRQLVELGLKVAPPALPPGHPLASDATRIEKLAVHELEGLLDPALSEDERERRIRRLTDGPPEFSHERIDLPKHRT
ncbi:ribbon-helix-helix domain-containing protein [Bradyrhizobium sp. WSM471]|nr:MULTISPECIES: ribbon-helix-helix domain-containing protein [Bradyrhizobium]UFW45129.1 ribbon-helix-helix domain-containing protein [Bradyrhizobium canariense]